MLSIKIFKTSGINSCGNQNQPSCRDYLIDKNNITLSFGGLSTRRFESYYDLNEGFNYVKLRNSFYMDSNTIALIKPEPNLTIALKTNKNCYSDFIIRNEYAYVERLKYDRNWTFYIELIKETDSAEMNYFQDLVYPKYNMLGLFFLSYYINDKLMHKNMIEASSSTNLLIQKSNNFFKRINKIKFIHMLNL